MSFLWSIAQFLHFWPSNSPLTSQFPLVNIQYIFDDWSSAIGFMSHAFHKVSLSNSLFNVPNIFRLQASSIGYFNFIFWGGLLSLRNGFSAWIFWSWDHQLICPSNPSIILVGYSRFRVSHNWWNGFFWEYQFIKDN